jgi:hypothetical protein
MMRRLLRWLDTLDDRINAPLELDDDFPLS